ncbi:MAG: aspartate aminotransferase family protein [Candidatus Competibacter sp.]|nr:aspartate aminotransferase family protein [Candidatus Competibacter sp.]
MDRLTHSPAQDADRLRDLLERALDASLDYLDSLDRRPPATAFARNPPLELPEDGLGAEGVFDLFMRRYGHAMPASNGPRFWGFVTGGTTPAALMGDWLTAVHDLNLSHAAHSVAPNIELEAIGWLRDLFGLPADFSGVFVTGATMANFVGLALGREWVAHQQGKSVAREGLNGLPPIAVFSGEAHSSIFKTLAMLGLGRNSLHAVGVLPGDREAADVAALRDALKRLDGQPCIVVANAGTVNTGDFDDLRAIAELKTRYRFWLHVDAAFGGFAACSPRRQHLLAGIDAADSITIDAHKWLNVPYDSGMMFTRHRDLQLSVFQNSAAYLGAIAEPPDFLHLSPENSRRLRALPAWFTLLAYGRNGYRDLVEHHCTLAGMLGERIAASTAFRLLAPVRLNIVCFTLRGEPDAEQVRQFLDRVRAGGRLFLTPTTFQGQAAMRAAFSNWRTREEDLEIAWRAMNALCACP